MDKSLIGIPCRHRTTWFGLDEALTGIPCQYLTRFGLEEALTDIPCQHFITSVAPKPNLNSKGTTNKGRLPI